MEEKYKYKFSIVVAVYNVEEYIEEAILSVINQDIGFKENIQLILVNDGSLDKSDRICKKYHNLYPNNIVYIEKENGGVSSARNEGMKHIQGKYMNFLDGDDKLNLDCLSAVYNFFERQHDYIDVISIPVKFFEGKEGEHILNYKYKETRQINLIKEYNNIQLFINSTFIKSEFKEKFQFTLNMKYAEDVEFVNKVLLEKCTMGVVVETNYWYRFRKSNSSAIQTGTQRKEWYTEYLNTFSVNLLKYAEEKFERIPKFIQYTVMYDLQWRFKLQKIDERILSTKEQKEFIDLLKRILYSIDDKIILEQKNLSIAHKKYILNLKYGINIEDKIKKIYSFNNIEFMYNEICLGNIHDEMLKIDILEVKDNVLTVEGFITKTILNEPYKIEFEFNDNIYSVNVSERKLYSKLSLGSIINKTYGFSIKLKIDSSIKQYILKIYLVTAQNRVRLNMVMGKFIRLNQDMKSSYFITNSHRILLKYNSIILLKNSVKVNVGREVRLLVELLSKSDFKAIIMRNAYFLFELFKRKKIYIFMERIDKADDNAEHLFRYALKQNDGIRKYFVISKESPDYDRIKKYGKVIKYNSIYHKFMLLLADKVISSQGEDNIRLPFRGKGKHVRELCNYKFIFLQHGIIKDNLSGWLNKYNKNLNMFVTSVYAEYQSILNEDYGYGKDVVKLTGLPRYDGLHNKNKKKEILIMPTWRSNIVCELDQSTGIRPYSKTFKESEYLKVYNSLLNNKKLLNYVSEKNYKIVFFPHPCIQQQINDFKINDRIIVPNYNESYQKMFNEASLLITDYSSVAFDFAYMQKPVIYYQFDRDTFFKGHTYTEGYFNYETMGMGPVYINEEDIVENVIKVIDDNCIMEDKYKKRVKSFYKYTDKNNCERVYKEIENI